MRPERKWFHSDNWSVDAWPPNPDGDVYWLDWRAVECCGTEITGPNVDTDRGKRFYQLLQDEIDDPDKASTYAHGSIKWDGCIDMAFDEQNECMLHFCGADSAIRHMVELFLLLDAAARYWMPESYERECGRDIERLMAAGLAGVE